MPVEPKRNAEQVIAAIGDSGGIKKTIAARLGVHRNSLDTYLDRYPTAKRAYDDEKEMVGDIAEDNVINSIKAGNVEDSKWYLAKKHRDRGYGDKSDSEVNGEIVLRIKYGEQGIDDPSA